MQPAICKPFLNPNSQENFIDFLKSDKSEIVIKSFNCILLCNHNKSNGKVYVTKNYLCFVKLPEKKIQCIIHFYHIDSIMLSADNKKVLTITTINKTFAFDLLGFRRPDLAASFIVNYWSIVVRPRDNKVSIVRHFQRSGRTTADDSCSSTSTSGLKMYAGLATSTPNFSPDNSIQLTSNISFDQYSPVTVNSLSSSKTTNPYESTLNKLSNILQFIRYYLLSMLYRNDEQKSTFLPFPMIIAYVIVFFLAISTFYVYHRMSKFPTLLLKVQHQYSEPKCNAKFGNSGDQLFTRLHDLIRVLRKFQNLRLS